MTFYAPDGKTIGPYCHHFGWRKVWPPEEEAGESGEAGAGEADEEKESGSNASA